MSIGFSGDAAEKLQSRVRRFYPLMTALLLIYSARLWYMQIYMGNHYRERSKIYRIRSERVPANRGNILDRTGTILVENRPGYFATIIPEDCPDLPELRDNLLEIIPNHAEAIQRRWSQLLAASKFSPFTLISELTFEDVVRLESRQSDIPGLSIAYDAKRSYLFGEQAAHMIGYMGKITPEEWERMKDVKDERIVKSDMIGKSGIERVLNSDLTGYPLSLIYEADAHGRKKEILNNPDDRSAIPGKDVTLTVDWDLQQYIEGAFTGFIGAVVVMAVDSGEILAMVNHPSFNPNLFSDGISVEEWQQLTSDESNPLIDRAIQAAYSPGSIFKIITATTAMEKLGLQPGGTTYFCGGTAKILNDYRDCWKRSGHGTMDLHSAIVNSCNIFFFNVATGLSMDDIASVAFRFGLGHKTGIILPHEEAGLIPTPEWKKRILKQPWWKGETLSVAIGQGSVLTTPLQLVRMMAAIANGGDVLQPRCVLRMGKEEERARIVESQLGLKKNVLSVLREGLRGVVNEQGGTARLAVIPGITVAGKTGTTQVVTKDVAKRYGKDIPIKYRDHNWFVCYAPYEEPKIAVVVFIEHGGKEGSSRKVLLARDIIDHYFNRKDQPKNNETLQTILETIEEEMSDDGTD